MLTLGGVRNVFLPCVFFYFIRISFSVTFYHLLTFLSTSCGVSSSWGLFPGIAVRRVTGVLPGSGVPTRCVVLGDWIHALFHLHRSAQTELESDLGAYRCHASVPAGGGAVAVHWVPAGQNGWKHMSRCAGPGWDLRAGPARAGSRGVYCSPLPVRLLWGKVQGYSLSPPWQAS